MNSNEINKQQDVENTNFDVKQIENDIEELLRISGFKGDNEGTRAYESLRHLYMAASIFAKMDEAERDVVAAEQKKLRNLFGVRCTLKSRKTRKSKRLPSPGTLSLQKEYKEKAPENLSIVGREGDAGFDGEAVAKTRKKRGRKSLRETLPYRKKDFMEECKTFGEKYDHKMINSFYFYWAQENRSGRKMRFEMEKTWNTAMRLASWAERSYQYENEAAKLRLERAKKGAVKQSANGRAFSSQTAENTAELQAIATKRAEDNARLEQEIAERKASAVSYEEYLKMKNEK